jgi:TRAP-type mannitol/chloroaromatic compound transport system permease small subunit
MTDGAGGASRLFAWIVKASNWVASMWICVLMLLIVADVLLRSLFNSPIVGVTEIMEMSIVAMLYLQVTQALRDGRHTRSEAFFGTLERRFPAAARAMNAVFYTAGLALMIAILYAGLPKTWESYSSGFTIGNQGVFIVPEWPVLLTIVFGCFLMAIQFVVLVMATLRGLASKPPPTIGPLV